MARFLLGHRRGTLNTAIRGNGYRNGKNVTMLFAKFPRITSYGRMYYVLNPNDN